MKKGLLALGAALLLTLFAVGALAEGQATITQQMGQTYAYEDVFYAYYFAQIENTGDVPIVLDGGTLENNLIIADSVWIDSSNVADYE